MFFSWQVTLYSTGGDGAKPAGSTISRRRQPAKSGPDGLGPAAKVSEAFGLARVSPHVPISFVPAVRVDLSSYLFGDILAVSRSDLLVIWGGGATVLGLIAWQWSNLLISTLKISSGS